MHMSRSKEIYCDTLNANMKNIKYMHMCTSIDLLMCKYALLGSALGCVYMCVSLYIHNMCIRIDLFPDPYTHAHTHAHIYTHTCIYTHAHTHENTQTHTHAYMHTHVHI